MSEYEIHEYCDIFPDLSDAELQEMAESIRANGQLQPIYRWNKKILDGKNRLKACKLAGVNPVFESWCPTNPADEKLADEEAWNFANALNYDRRHLSASQRSMHAAMRLKRKSANLHSAETIKSVAKKENVSVRSVKNAKDVIANGTPELQHAVTNGHVAVSDAAKVSKLPKKTQDAAVKAVTNGHAKTVAKAVEREPGDETENDKPRRPKSEKVTVPIPAIIKPAADTLTEFASAIQACGKLREQVRGICEGPGGGKLSRLWGDMERMLEQIAVNLKSYRFWAACPECKVTDKQKKSDANCKLCRGHGWIAKTNGLSDIHKSWLMEQGYDVK